jgi:ABC-2 type transport system permease protein
MIDGFRYGFFGVADVSPLRSLAVVACAAAGLAALNLVIFSRGWKLRH